MWRNYVYLAQLDYIYDVIETTFSIPLKQTKTDSGLNYLEKNPTNKQKQKQQKTHPKI